ncbi:glycoside hydrolase family 15 protein [Streptosporangium amethystogenes]|uniref:glycoside hydrolase family 15 protein n=1 Tax=Streptosporangium amethystogenes TaxID=2002 RepID=UPI0004CBED71|nr:glycoside hydrolase family 15 protein [Streptosporangium amethystogenes]
MTVFKGGIHSLREYAVIADGERAALIDPDGGCAWMCFPSWDSPAVFSTLVGGAGGYWVRPEDEWRVWGGYYEERSLIWRSRWVTGDGVVECREALGRPADSDRAILLRRVEAIRGPARIRVELNMRADFSRHTMTSLRRSGQLWTGRSGEVRIRWAGAAHAEPVDGGLAMCLDLGPGQAHDLVLELSAGDHTDPLAADALWAATENDWRASVPACDDTIAPRDAQLAYAVLTGLTSRTGGMVAAVTTSLPERSGGQRNYDYRYAWIRDQCYAGQAVAAHGGRLELLDTSVAFVAERILTARERLRPAYTVTGHPVPSEAPAPLPGYPGGNMIVGNRVTGQFQLDVFGEALLLFAAAQRADRLPPEAVRAARTAVAAIAKRWQEPEAGIWEIDDRRWTHSRLTCVAGLRAFSALVRDTAETAGWLSLAETILAATTKSSLHVTGRWRRAPDDDRIDASLLLPPLRGALSGDDPRTVATLAAVRDTLVQEGFVYRYRIDERPLGQAEGAFTLCGFLLALAEHQQGNTARALGCFERIRSSCGTTGLFTEEYDVVQRRLRANLPQAFAHAMLLESATRLAR